MIIRIDLAIKLCREHTTIEKEIVNNRGAKTRRMWRIVQITKINTRWKLIKKGGNQYHNYFSAIKEDMHVS